MGGGLGVFGKEGVGFGIMVFWGISVYLYCSGFGSSLAPTHPTESPKVTPTLQPIEGHVAPPINI